MSNSILKFFVTWQEKTLKTLCTAKWHHINSNASCLRLEVLLLHPNWNLWIKFQLKPLEQCFLKSPSWCTLVDHFPIKPTFETSPSQCHRCSFFSFFNISCNPFSGLILDHKILLSIYSMNNTYFSSHKFLSLLLVSLKYKN
jgi:hypothetical protein